jgi:hypothetical protein
MSTTVMIALFVTALVRAQAPPVDALVAAVRRALPFPTGDETGDQPAADGADARWFVVWPGPGSENRITVKANPLHPETQRAGVAAMARIQEAIVAAERKAQAAYDRAVEEVKRTGIPTDVAGISLDDEGVAGERIDAELELSIVLHSTAQSIETASSEPPTVAAGSNGVTWILRTPANVYRMRSGGAVKEHFRPAEAHLYFGALPRPVVSRKGDDDVFAVSVSPAPRAFVVVLRGNEELLTRVLATADWTHLKQ